MNPINISTNWLSDFRLLGVCSLGVLAFFVLLRKMKPGFGPNNLKALGLCIASTTAALVWAVDPSESTRAALFGLLSTIVGFIFGQGLEENSNDKTKSLKISQEQ